MISIALKFMKKIIDLFGCENKFVNTFKILGRRKYKLEKYDYIFMDRLGANASRNSKDYFDAVMSEIGLNLNHTMFSYNQWGKPYICGQRLNFSISHSQKIICLAITTSSSIGIDCESMIEREKFLEFARRFFTRNEYQLIHKSNKPLEKFYYIWCSKEALLKYYGVGLMFPLNSFDVTREKKIESDQFEVDCPIFRYIGTHLKCKVVSFSQKPLQVVKGKLNKSM